MAAPRCTWTAATGDLATLHTTDVAVDPVDGATAYVTAGDGGTTASDGGIVPASNAVFVTHDHGAHFARLPSLSGRIYLSVRVAASDPKTIYVTSASSTAPLDLAVHRSSDGGTSFTTTTLSYQLDGNQLVRTNASTGLSTTVARYVTGFSAASNPNNVNQVVITLTIAYRNFTSTFTLIGVPPS